MQGISQINTAVTQLDQMTQENAKVASEADAIADTTIAKANIMVEDASSKNFQGKEEVKASAAVKTKSVKNTVTVSKPVLETKPQRSHQNKSDTFAPKKNNVENNDDQWESF